jgi:hypothetical protein
MFVESQAILSAAYTFAIGDASSISSTMQLRNHFRKLTKAENILDISLDIEVTDDLGFCFETW